MSNIDFSSEDSKTGAVFTPQKYFVGNIIEDMNACISIIRKQLYTSTLREYEYNQSNMNKASNAFSYATLFQDIPNLKVSVLIDDNLEIKAIANNIGQELVLRFIGYKENLSGNIRNGLFGTIKFNEINIEYTAKNNNNHEVYNAIIKGDFSVEPNGLSILDPVSLSSNINSIDVYHDKANKAGINKFKYIGDLYFSDKDNNSEKDYFNYITKGSDIIIGTKLNDNIKSGGGDDSINGNGGSDILDGQSGSDTAIFDGEFNDYSFSRSSENLKISNSNDGTICILNNFEFVKFIDQKVEESKVDKNITYSGKFSDYKFYNRGNNKYEIKHDNGFDDITGIPKIDFSDKTISAIADIKQTFDLVTDKDDVTGKTFRLYNAAFARFPDSDGLEYWIKQRSSGANSERDVSLSFLSSPEFENLYGKNISHSTFVNNLYKNILGRGADEAGLNYWVNNLSNGLEDRHVVLLGFSESAENKALFTEITGFG